MLRLLTLAAAALLPVSVHAADMPKEGTDSFTNTWMATSPDPIKVGDRTLGTYELSGIHRNDNGQATIANMVMRCLGIYEMAGTAPQQDHGACTFTDKDGDQIMLTYDRKTETLALVRRYREAEAAQVPIEQRATALRARWLARPGGEPIPRELNRPIAESDRLTETMADLILEMMETPATTLVGVIAKLRVGLELYPAELDHPDEATFAFAEDAVKLLEGLVA